jgi:hypothetical protein
MALIGLSGTSGAATTAPSTTTTTLPKPAVTLVGPASETIQLTKAGTGGQEQGRITVVIQNTGTRIAGARLSFIADPTARGPSPQIVLSTKSPPLVSDHTNDFALAPFGVTTRSITVVDRSAGDNNVTAVLTVLRPVGVGPTTETFKLLRSPSVWNIWLPVLMGLGFALIFFLTRGYFWWREIQEAENFRIAASLQTQSVRRYTQGRIYRQYLNREVFPPASWTFGGSWVTLISVLGAVLATVLGTSGLITDVFPSIDVERFVVLNLVLGGAVLAGPLIYSAASRVDRQPPPGSINGRAIGLLCASTVTLIGVAGQLAGMAELAWLSNASIESKIGISVAAGLVGALLYWYSFQSVNQLVRLPRPATGSPNPSTLVTAI